MGSISLFEPATDGIAVVDVEKPCNLAAIPHLLDDLISIAGALNAGDMNARQELLTKLRTLTSAIETPRETVMRHCWTMVSLSLTRPFYSVIDIQNRQAPLAPFPLTSTMDCGKPW